MTDAVATATVAERPGAAAATIDGVEAAPAGPATSMPAAAPSPARDRALQLVLEAAGWLLWGLAVLRLLQLSDRQVVGPYDEGILLTNAQLLRSGALPYRDFYTNYPPGVFALLAGLFAVFGPSVAVERALGIVVRAAMGLVAMRLCGQLVGRRWCSIAGGLVTAWTLCLGTEPFAYVLAVFVALGAVSLWSSALARGTRLRYGVAGAALGAVSWFRHDLFGLFAAALLFVGVAAQLRGRWRAASTVPPMRTPWPWFAGGAALAVALFWLPVMLVCGPRQLLFDLVFDQARHVLPARHLPMPSLLQPTFGGGLLVPLPAALQRPFEGAIALSFLGPLLAALAAKRATTAPQRGGALVLGALALAVIPQLLGRTDLVHAVYTVPPALVLFAVLLGRATGSVRRRAGLALLAIAACTWQLRDVLPPTPPRTLRVLPLLERAAGRPVRAEAARLQLLQFVAANSTADEPVWFGLADHSAVDSNEVDLYFFADRRGATRYLQFDPELVDRADVQEQMIGELERSGVRIAVTSALPARRVRSDGGKGSDRLDRWLAEHFEVVRTVGPYRLLRRRDGR